MPLVKREIAILLALLFLSGCQGVQSGETCSGERHICIRVDNASDFDFESFKVNFSGQMVEFGQVDAGQISAYRKVEVAYRYAATEAFSDERRFILQPIDFVGERTLLPGRYTYRYYVDELDEPRIKGDWSLHGYMSVRLVVDDGGT